MTSKFKISSIVNKSTKDSNFESNPTPTYLFPKLIEIISESEESSRQLLTYMLARLNHNSVDIKIKALRCLLKTCQAAPPWFRLQLRNALDLIRYHSTIQLVQDPLRGPTPQNIIRHLSGELLQAVFQEKHASHAPVQNQNDWRSRINDAQSGGGEDSSAYGNGGGFGSESSDTGSSIFSGISNTISETISALPFNNSNINTGFDSDSGSSYTSGDPPTNLGTYEGYGNFMPSKKPTSIQRPTTTRNPLTSDAKSKSYAHQQLSSKPAGADAWGIKSSQRRNSDSVSTTEKKFVAQMTAGLNVRAFQSKLKNYSLNSLDMMPDILSNLVIQNLQKPHTPWQNKLKLLLFIEDILKKSLLDNQYSNIASHFAKQSISSFLQEYTHHSNSQIRRKSSSILKLMTSSFTLENDIQSAAPGLDVSDEDEDTLDLELAEPEYANPMFSQVDSSPFNAQPVNNEYSAPSPQSFHQGSPQNFGRVQGQPGQKSLPFRQSGGRSHAQRRGVGVPRRVNSAGHISSPNTNRRNSDLGIDLGDNNGALGRGSHHSSPSPLPQKSDPLASLFDPLSGTNQQPQNHHQHLGQQHFIPMGSPIGLNNNPVRGQVHHAYPQNPNINQNQVQIGSPHRMMSPGTQVQAFGNPPTSQAALNSLFSPPPQQLMIANQGMHNMGQHVFISPNQSMPNAFSAPAELFQPATPLTRDQIEAQRKSNSQRKLKGPSSNKDDPFGFVHTTMKKKLSGV